MKNLLFYTLISLCFFNEPLFSQKSSKFGHVNASEILNLMPERKTALAKLDTSTKELDKQLQEMMNEYRSKEEKYRSESSKLSDLIKADKEAEIQGLATRIQAFQQQAEESIQKRQQELMEPVLVKARKAIEQVAKENGYTYIFDTSTGAFLYFEESDNILALVKKKLNLP